MTHTKHVTKYTANFIDELVRNGLTDVVISPGSRSTPLAMMVKERDELKDWIVIDERSAAFFALGIAKQKKRPVALICTSGTAAVNYHPAIVEAFYSREPLIVLTTDRPHELRDIGAPQAIDQTKLYGDHVKWFHEMALPDSSTEMLTYARRQAARAFHQANTGNKGPVHLNFPFREPLVPDFTIENLWENEEGVNEPFISVQDGPKVLSEDSHSHMFKMLSENKRGVIVCGPQQDAQAQEEIIQFAQTWKLPVLADPLSQLRTGTFAKDVVIDSYDAILRDEKVRKKLKPDFILRFGAMPVSKMYLFYVQEHGDVPQFVVEASEGFREPASEATTFLYADPKLLAKELTVDKEREKADWLELWQQMNETVHTHLFTEAEANITEGEAVRAVREAIPENSALFVGNSMPIRDVDTFFTNTNKSVHILANRGVNGIDGVTSSALGASTAAERVTLIIGDLSFYHDLNSLLIAKHYNLDVTIVLVNNDGGGIFSFLPQAENGKHFEELFGTPTGLDFQPAVEMFGSIYERARTEEELKEKLIASYVRKGLSVIEVQTDREENARWHRLLWGRINQDLWRVLTESEFPS